MAADILHIEVVYRFNIFGIIERKEKQNIIMKLFMK
jgi:hypothetical protein